MRKGILLVFLLISAFIQAPVHYFSALPTAQQAVVGEKLTLAINWPKTWQRFLQIVNVNYSPAISLQQGQPVAREPGEAELAVKLFGFLPLHRFTVRVLPEMHLIPGGQSIGVLLKSRGVMVVGYAPITSEGEEKIYPGRDAGVLIGDTILAINGKNINNEKEMAEIITQIGQKGEKAILTIERRGTRLQVAVTPRFCPETQSYRIGLYIRDSASGVGTLTFIEPKKAFFGALGHIIADSDTSEPIDIREGKIVRAVVQAIHKGKEGFPGEKLGVFVDDGSWWGEITHNTQVGIFGRIYGNFPASRPLPVVSNNQVETGPAQILTVINGEKVEAFTINIKKLLPPDRPDGKGMVVEITDPRLLKETGGIIQGMSGSPIIQKGRIVGAVTHVLVNNPRLGYGCYIEKMLEEAGLVETWKKAAS
ncbi:MAG: SpoIVB peptidase [Bacillota bacterium]